MVSSDIHELEMVVWLVKKKGSAIVSNHWLKVTQYRSCIYDIVMDLVRVQILVVEVINLSYFSIV